MSAACVLSPMCVLILDIKLIVIIIFSFGLLFTLYETLLDRKPILQEFFYEIFG
jgi:hypothetical protein